MYHPLFLSEFVLLYRVIRNTFFFLMCCLWWESPVYSQSYTPGPTAQGYDNYLLSMVDHSTGIFRYHLPLFELAAPHYVLPVTLDYVANGVKWGSDPGLYGLNWNLYTGGAVTRTMRGNFPDPYWGQGRLLAGSEEWRYAIHNGEIDGENDYFNASFNGKSVKFILRSEDGETKAEALERTDVRIEAEIKGHEIQKWVITDDTGVRYIFSVPQWSRLRRSADKVGVSLVSPTDYISAWYLSAIEVPNGETFRYTYEEPGKRPQQPSVIYGIGQKPLCTYYYGEPVQEHTFNFRRYEKEFSVAMTRIANSASPVSLPEAFHDNVNQYRLTTHAFRESENYTRVASSKEVPRLFGLDFALLDIELSVFLILKTLNSHESHPVYGKDFTIAKNAVLQSCGETRDIAVKTRAFEGDELSETPLKLQEISVGKQSLRFVYQREALTEIHCYVGNKRLGKVCLERKNEYFLKSVARYDSDDKLVQKQVYDYYFEGLDPNEMKNDLWKGFVGYEGSTERTGAYGINPNTVSSFSLSRITTFPGYETRIVYESNEVASGNSVSLYGGIRVNCIMVDDGFGNRDTIKYRYPIAGTQVYGDIESYYVTSGDFGAFQDRFKKPFVELEGRNVNEGNSGLFYRYVEEELVGKGYNTYLFFVPQARYRQVAYGFWLYGLPLARASYDKGGRLVELERNTYMTDLHNADSTVYQDSFYRNQWFYPGPEAFGYSRKLPQTRSYKFLSDAIHAKYWLSSSSAGFGSLHKQLINDYKVGLAPRLNVNVPPKYNYELVYGGKTVLSDKEVFHFDETSPVGISIDHLKNPEIPAGAYLVSRNSFSYENSSRSIRPLTQLIRQANGDEYLTVSRGPLDFEDHTDAVLDEMKALNVVAPIVKQQTFFRKKNESQFCLQGEYVHYYRPYSPTGKSFFLPVESWQTYVDGSSYTLREIPARDKGYMTFTPSSYQKIWSVDYIQQDSLYLEEQVYTPEERILKLYDGNFPAVILESPEISRNMVDAVNFYSFEGEGDGNAQGSVLKVQNSDKTNNMFILRLLMKPSASSVVCSYSFSGREGRASLMASAEAVKPGQWQLLTFILKSTGLKKTETMWVNLPDTGQVAYAVLTSSEVAFEATSYDDCGRVFARFDHTGSLERYEYDGRGRLVAVYDQEGNILFKQKYNY